MCSHPTLLTVKDPSIFVPQLHYCSARTQPWHYLQSEVKAFDEVRSLPCWLWPFPPPNPFLFFSLASCCLFSLAPLVSLWLLTVIPSAVIYFIAYFIITYHWHYSHWHHVVEPQQLGGIYCTGQCANTEQKDDPHHWSSLLTYKISSPSQSTSYQGLPKRRHFYHVCCVTVQHKKDLCL